MTTVDNDLDDIVIKDESLVVYNNIYKFMEYRKIVPNVAKMSDDVFLRNFIHFGFILIEGKGADNRRDFSNTKQGSRDYNILFIEKNSDIGLKAKDFNKKIMELSRGIKSVNIIVITKYELSKHIKREILSIKTINKLISIDAYSYNPFLLIIPEHEAVPKHEIVSADELKIYIDDYNLNKYDLQKIHSTDPAIIWLGAGVGDIVKISRISDTTGISTTFRVVIK